MDAVNSGRSDGRSRLPLSVRLGAPVALVFALSFGFVSGDADAAALRNSAATLGALTLFGALLFMREWPVALAGSIWAAGTLFAAVLWFLHTRYRVEWFPFGSGSRARITANGRLGVLDVAGAATAVGALRPAPCSGADPNDVLAAARQCFISMQAAWDASDIETMRLHTTAEMLEELLQEISMRGPGPNRTDVLTLDATLLGLEAFGCRLLASVEFSGMIRESTEQGAAPFKEMWMLTCHQDEVPGWRLARHQALL